jgi:hypothetical protein
MADLGWRFVWAAHQYQLSTEEETEETVESNVAGQYEIAEPFGNWRRSRHPAAHYLCEHAVSVSAAAGYAAARDSARCDLELSGVS